MFEEQTLDRIALRATLSTSTVDEQDATDGLVPLTPIQHWFFEHHIVAPNHFNQSVVIELPQRIEAASLHGALACLADHHHSLRLRFERTDAGWTQQLTGASATSVSLREVSLVGLSPLDARSLVESVERELQTGLDLGSGPLVNAALLDRGSGEAQQVLLVVHHLATDWVSWRILVPDLLTACQQDANRASRLPPPTSSFRRWAEWLVEYSQQELVEAEVGYWQGVLNHPAPLFPTDFPKRPGSNLVEHSEVVEVSLGSVLTRALLKDVPGVYHTHINDILLLALLRTLAPWMKADSLLLDVEGHGRESESLDLARTVGWFTSLFPVVLILGRSDTGEAIKSVKEQLRRIPNRGIGYGVLRYLNPVTRGKLEHLRRPEVRFNYGGQFASLDVRSRAGDCAPNEQLSHMLSIDGAVIGDELSFSWTYSTGLFRRETIQRLADQFSRVLQELVSHCGQPQVGGYTPSDFPLASLTAAQLDSLAGDGRNIEDIYPLSPVQAGMLFHSLLAPTSGVYYVQTTIRLGGALDERRLKRAWQSVVDRHAALRTGFAWLQIPQPLQIVYRTLPLIWQARDWRELSVADQQVALSQLLEEGRRSSAQVSRPPLSGCMLIKLGDDDHFFVWQCHHLLLDGWSSSIVLDELFRLYEYPALELPTPRPYRDYISWCAQQDPASVKRFWDDRLSGFTKPTRFSQVTQSAQTFRRYEIHRRALSTDLTNLLSGFAQAHQLTTNTLVQGAYALLLACYSGDDDVVFGVTVSGRSGDLVGAEDIVGLLINTLPLRVKLPSDSEVVPWLQELQLESAQLCELAGSSLAEIRRSSHVPTGAPLFDSILVFENYPTDRQRVGFSRSLEIGEPMTDERTHYPLTVIVEPGVQISLSLSHSLEELDADQVSRMVGHLEALLESMVSNPRQTLAMVSPMTESERRRVLWELHPFSTVHASSPSLHEGFERQVSRSPCQVALTFGGETLTYGALNQAANRLARHLGSLGVQPGSLVGIFAARSFDLIIGILAVLKAGAAYVPLEPDYPEARLSFMLRDANVSILLSHTLVRSRLPHTEVRVVWMDDMAAALDVYSSGDLCLPSVGDARAYVMYTSGSTGHPKGVEVSHSNVMRLFAATDALFSFSSRDVWTLFHSPSFDFSVWEIWGALLHGGRLVIVDHLTARSPDEFLDLLVRERVSILNQTPSAFLHLMAAEAKTPDPELLCLRLVIFGGERLVAPRLRAWFERPRSKPPKLVNMYGITETTVHVTYREVTSADALGAEGSFIGMPIADLRVFVLDQRLRLVPIGVPGEMYVAGPGVALGYLNGPQLTQERFVRRDSIPALADLVGFSRLYRTGDVARFLPDGSLEFLGRCDDQVKVRGFRIEPGEVEGVLARHPLVRDVVVVAGDDGAGQSRLIAYVVCHAEPKERDRLIAEMRDCARHALPDYMVPSVFQVLDQLPLTLNGKIDRLGLPGIDFESLQRTSDAVPLQSPTEQILCEVWSEVLRVRCIGRHDDFFELGGHSLNATQVVGRLQAILGVTLPVRLLFEHPILAAFGTEVDSLVRLRNAWPALPEFGNADRGGELPLSFSQQRLWFIDQFEGANPAYHVSLAVRLRGPLQAPAMEGALSEIVRRHEILRTTFPDQEGVARQRIASTQSLELAMIDLEPLGVESAGQELERRLTEDCRAPFELRTGPLFRASLYRLGERDHMLLLAMHHIVSDGWSLGVLWRELAVLYPAHALGEPSHLPALRYQYADFAVWQRAWLKGEVLAAQLQYWKTHLAGAPTLLDLPTDRPRPQLQRSGGGTVIRVIEAAVTGRLGQIGREQGASLFMVCHAAFAALLYRYTGQDDIVVGVPVAGRRHRATEDLVGLFVNTLPLRIQLAGSTGFDSVLAGTRQVTLDAFAHQDMPFELLVSALQIERSTSYTPLFQVMLAFESFGGTAQPLGDLSSQPIELLPGAVQYDLALNLSVVDATIRAGFEYNEDLFNASTIERMADHFQLLLKGIVENPRCGIARLPILTEPERQALLVEWDNTATGYCSDRCVHEIFEAQAMRTPLEIAVRYEIESLTYKELNERSNRAARGILRAGFEPGGPIAILSGDGPDQVIALLATLKAGGVIVGLPPDVPKERMAHILAEVSPGCIVTDHANRARVSGVATPVFVIDRECEDHPVGDIERSASPSGPIYVVYTSGSTGRPKGIVQSHASFGQFIDWFARQYKLRPGKRVAQWASIGYDGSYLEIFATLCAGATLCMLPWPSRMDPLAVLAWIKRERVSLLNVVPSFFRPIMACLEAERAGDVEQPLPDLEFLLLDGEVLPVELARRWLTEFPRTPRLFNQYGPTECVLATFCPVEHVSPVQRSVPVGRAIEGRQILILDRCEQLAPIGVAGEIYVRSRFLTNGYFEQPQLTNAAFLPNPLGGDPEDLVYRTGDMGRWLSDGNLRVLGPG